MDSPYQKPPLPEYPNCSSTEDLANAILKEGKSEDWHDGLSEPALRRLVDLAFWTSVSSDEGRYSRFRIVASESGAAIANLSEFEPVPIHGVNDLRRLAPACTHYECALVIVETAGALQCVGIAAIGPMGYEWKPGWPYNVGVGINAHLEIAVRGPGFLVVTDGMRAIEFRNGQLRDLQPYWLSPPIKRARGEFEAVLSNSIEATKLKEPPDWSASSFRGLFSQVLTRILRTAIEAEHGGAFVLLPEMNDTDVEQSVSIKYVTRSLSISKAASDFWSANVQYREHFDAGNVAGLDEATRRAIVLRTKLLTIADLVGNLSAVDGCVILAQGLRAIGFGGVIKVSEAQAKARGNVFRVNPGAALGYEEFKQRIGGTRHQSAARLCSQIQGALVFVVSQDSTIKLFHSDEAGVELLGPLDLPLLRQPS